MEETKTSIVVAAKRNRGIRISVTERCECVLPNIYPFAKCSNGANGSMIAFDPVPVKAITQKIDIVWPHRWEQVRRSVGRLSLRAHEIQWEWFFVSVAFVGARAARTRLLYYLDERESVSLAAPALIVRTQNQCVHPYTSMFTVCMASVVVQPLILIEIENKQ